MSPTTNVPQVTTLSRFEGQLAKGEYAMWWPTKEEPSFANSVTVACIDRWFEAVNGIESYVLASLLRGLKAVKETTVRVRLPKSAQIPVKGPEGRVFLLHISEEKGISWHFHTKTTAPAYRYAVWKLTADFADEWKRTVATQKLPPDPPPSGGYSSPLDHWRLLKRSLAPREQELATVGVIVV